MPDERPHATPEEPAVEIRLPLRTAERLHAALEDLLEGDGAEPALEEAYRILAWRILAAKAGAGGAASGGLTARMAELAREARTVGEYEAARDEVLGPILDGLESAENRDP